VLVVAVSGLALVAQGAAAQPEVAERCRALSILRLKGGLYFHHQLRIRRPELARRQGIALERACDDTPDPYEPPPWVPVPVFALEGIRPTAAVAPGRRQVIFYDIYRCSPRFGETRFLRCLKRQ
jgi:hypothetical protein